MCMMILLNEKLYWVRFIQLKIRILMFWVLVLKFGFKDSSMFVNLGMILQ